MIGRLLTLLLIILLWSGAGAQNVPSRQIVVQQPGDANATIAVATTNVWTTSLSTTRTWTLPAASVLVKGSQITVTDLGGAISTPGNNIIISPNGSDTINGLGTITLSQPYASITLMSNGSNGWVASSSAAGQPAATNLTSVTPYGVVQGPLTLMKIYPTPTQGPGSGMVQLLVTKGTGNTCTLSAIGGTSTTPTAIISNFGTFC